jgi:hypothetical protein
MNDDSSAARPEPGTDPAFARTPRVPAVAIAADAVRHLLPLASLYLLHGNFANYTLLTAFDLSLGLMLIVGTTRDRKDPTSVDPRSRWLVMRVMSVFAIAVFLAIFAAIIAVPIAAPALLLGLASGVDWRASASSHTFWIPVAGMSLLAGARAERAFEATTAPGHRGQPTNKGPIVGDLERDRKSSLAAYAAQVTLIATFVLLCYVLITFGRRGLYALPILYAALLVAYDARPDIAQRIFPKLWQRD